MNMGLFDDFNIDMDDVKAASFDIDDGTYEFEISEAGIRNGTKKKPDDTFFVIEYDLDENGKKQEWFTVAIDGDTTAPRAKQSLSFLKTRLLDLGLGASALNDVSPDDLEGLRGTLQLKTTKNAKGEFQNVKNVKVLDDAPEPEEDDEPEEDVVAATKARVAAKRAARAQAEEPAPAKKAPAKRAAKPVADDEDDDNPFG